MILLMGIILACSIIIVSSLATDLSTSRNAVTHERTLSLHEEFLHYRDLFGAALNYELADVSFRRGLQGEEVPGDANGDGYCDNTDLVFLVDYLANAGPAPEPFLSGDVNDDDAVNGIDVVYLASFLNEEGPAPLAHTSTIPDRFVFVCSSESQVNGQDIDAVVRAACATTRETLSSLYLSSDLVVDAALSHCWFERLSADGDALYTVEVILSLTDGGLTIHDSVVYTLVWNIPVHVLEAV